MNQTSAVDGGVPTLARREVLRRVAVPGTEAASSFNPKNAGEAIMSMGDKIKNTAEEATGKVKETAGKVKETAGKATDDEQLEAEGQGDQAKAKQAGEKVKDTAKDVLGN